MRPFLALVALAIAAKPCHAIPRPLPERYRSQVAESLRLSGSNRQALEAFLAQVGEEQWEEACFLVASLPYRDLGTISEQLLTENLGFAALARDSLPWGASVPDDVFRHYVLPHRATQERLTRWRRELFEQLHPIVKDCESMASAALALNRWLASHVRFEPTEARDQAPLTTLARGVGRCEERTILYVGAAR